MCQICAVVSRYQKKRYSQQPSGLQLSTWGTLTETLDQPAKDSASNAPAPTITQPKP